MYCDGLKNKSPIISKNLLQLSSIATHVIVLLPLKWTLPCLAKFSSFWTDRGDEAEANGRAISISVKEFPYGALTLNVVTGPTDCFQGQGTITGGDLTVNIENREKNSSFKSLWFTSVFNLFLHLPTKLFCQCKIITTILSMIQYCACWWCIYKIAWLY